jgi:hypothetical protein
MSYYDDDLTDKAVSLYHRWSQRSGLIPQQPNRQETERDGDVIHIRNIKGELARYRVLPGGRLRKMWPRTA